MFFFSRKSLNILVKSTFSRLRRLYSIFELFSSARLAREENSGPARFAREEISTASGGQIPQKISPPPAAYFTPPHLILPPTLTTLSTLTKKNTVFVRW